MKILPLTMWQVNKLLNKKFF